MVDATSKDAGRRLTKNEKRRMRKKEAKHDEEPQAEKVQNNSSGTDHNNEDVEVEYVSADIKSIAAEDPLFAQFEELFEKFAKPEELTGAVAAPEEEEEDEGQERYEENEDDSAPKISRRKKKLMSRLSVAELKQLVPRPDVVEAHDVTSSDPKLLVFLKAYRNTVPVPRHWCHKRKYLMGKRGIDKGPFKLPEFIADTGIAKIRESVLEHEALKKSKHKARDKMTPKMGRIDIDYQVLHDAFFKYQTKPKMTEHGDIYYEGKEFEVDLKEKKPGQISPELSAALGMLEGAPPPWLVNMQRYGPPPAYPNLKIPGLNAPIPEGASFGYHPGGWGKPPVDDYGRPIYGDVFGTSTQKETILAPTDVSHWGEVMEVSSESESESEEEIDVEMPPPVAAEEHTGGVETPYSLSGVNSILSTVDAPETIDLRKKNAIGLETPEVGNKELYKILPERQAATGKQIFGSDRSYALPSKGDVQMSINPDQLEDKLRNMSEQDVLKDAYDELEGDSGMDRDDPRGKRKRRADATAASKRHKDFKF